MIPIKTTCEVFKGRATQPLVKYVTNGPGFSIIDGHPLSRTFDYKYAHKWLLRKYLSITPKVYIGRTIQDKATHHYTFTSSPEG